MEFAGKYLNLARDYRTGKFKVTFLIDSNESIEGFDEIRKFNQLNITVKKKRKRRSLDANALAWELIGKIAEKMELRPIEVYKEEIKSLGIFQIVPVKKEFADKFIEKWTSRGDGWICEKMLSKLQGYVNVKAYFGSSSYDSKEMSRFINILLEDCRALQIQLPDKEELEKVRGNQNE